MRSREMRVECGGSDATPHVKWWNQFILENGNGNMVAGEVIHGSKFTMNWHPCGSVVKFWNIKAD